MQQCTTSVAVVATAALLWGSLCLRRPGSSEGKKGRPIERNLRTAKRRGKPLSPALVVLLPVRRARAESLNVRINKLGAWREEATGPTRNGILVRCGCVRACNPRHRVRSLRVRFLGQGAVGAPGHVAAPGRLSSGGKPNRTNRATAVLYQVTTGCMYCSHYCYLIRCVRVLYQEYY